MAPLNFWLKRQLSLPGTSILFPPPSAESTPRETLVESSASPAASASSTTSQEVETPISSSTPTRPTQTVIDDIEESQEEQLPSATPSAPSTSEAILIQSASTPEPQTSEPLAESTRVVVAHTTVTNDVPTSSTGLPAQVGATKGGNAFLDNKVLSGVVFAICGLVGLVLIGLLIWVATRKARENKKLEQEIISWDPDHVRGFSNTNATQAGQNAETRSIDELEEKGRSLDGHFNTYTLPSQTMHAQSNQAASGGYSDYYSAQRPIQVTLPPGETQPYRANW